VEAHLLLPGLRPTAADGPPDLTVLFQPELDASFRPEGAWRGTRLSPDGTEPTLQVHRPPASTAEDAGFWRFRYSDETTFLVSEQGDQVRCTWRAPLTLEDTVTYLLGPILGFVLRLRGTTALHASAVEVAGQVVAFAADGGTGKSTTAAAFARAGHRVLTDDICALVDDGQFLVQPSYPRLRLWPSSVEALFGDAEALPPLTPNWDKRGYDLEAATHGDEPAPLAHLFLLTYSDPDDRDVPRIETATGPLALLELVRHVYGQGFSDKAGRGRDFDLLTRLVERVPVSWLYLPDDLAALGTVVDCVAAHLLSSGSEEEAHSS